jgi:hypothetical protein
VFGSEAKLAGKGCQTYALWVGNPFSFFVCRVTKILSFYRFRFWFFSLVPNGQRYVFVADFEALHCQATMKFEASHNRSF